MTNLLTLTFSRTSLSLSSLLIGTDPTAGLWLPEDSVTEPGRTVRRAYAPDSAFIPGRYLLSAVEDAATVPVTVYARGATGAELAANRAILDAAASQFNYSLTLTVDGVARTWSADPELPQWGLVDTGMVRARIARAVLVIPVNPA